MVCFASISLRRSTHHQLPESPAKNRASRSLIVFATKGVPLLCYASSPKRHASNRVRADRLGDRDERGLARPDNEIQSGPRHSRLLEGGSYQPRRSCSQGGAFLGGWSSFRLLSCPCRGIKKRSMTPAIHASRQRPNSNEKTATATSHWSARVLPRLLSDCRLLVRRVERGGGLGRQQKRVPE